MALEVAAAVVTGVVAGWIGRSLTSSTRGLLVGAVVTTLRARDGLTRIFAHTSEWMEDVIAEGQARYESKREQSEQEPLPAEPATEAGPDA
jgi:hypothetical protein